MIGKTESIIRKRWCFIYLLTNSISYFIRQKNGLVFPAKDIALLVQDYVAIQEIYIVFILNGMYLFFLAFFMWMFFYFPYIRKGVKVLFFSLLCEISSLPFLIIGCMRLIKKTGFSSNFLLVFSLIISSALFVYCSLDLLSINRAYKFSLKNEFLKSQKILQKLEKRFN